MRPRRQADAGEAPGRRTGSAVARCAAARLASRSARSASAAARVACSLARASSRRPSSAMRPERSTRTCAAPAPRSKGPRSLRTKTNRLQDGRRSAMCRRPCRGQQLPFWPLDFWNQGKCTEQLCGLPCLTLPQPNVPPARRERTPRAYHLLLQAQQVLVLVGARRAAAGRAARARRQVRPILVRLRVALLLLALAAPAGPVSGLPAGVYVLKSQALSATLLPSSRSTAYPSRRASPKPCERLVLPHSVTVQARSC